SALLRGAEAFHHPVLDSDDFREVHPHLRRAHAPARSVPDIVRGLSGGKHRFGGSASGVYAGAAQMLLLNQRDRPALVCHAVSGRIACLPGSDDNGVEWQRLTSVDVGLCLTGPSYGTGAADYT